jgi:hypothetical protein
MTTAAELQGEHDITAVPAIVVGSVKLGLLESVLVLLSSLAFRLLAGPLETIVCAIILLAGVSAVTLLPGLWVRPRTIEGIAGAAGIGLGAAGVFLLIDVVLLQNIGTYSHRWLEVGGGSNWWYHPVWWMVGTFLPWMGGWMLANQLTRTGQFNVQRLLVTVLGLTLLVAVVAVLIGVPGAGWNLGTFGVAVLPALALGTIVTALRNRRT